MAGGDNHNPKEFARNLIDARKQLDKSFSIPQLRETEEISSLPLPQILSLHRSMQDRLIQGSFIPSTVSEQYRFEEQHNFRQIKANDLSSNQLHIYVNLEASKLTIRAPLKLYFSIWNRQTGYITDEFFVALTDKGFVTNMDLFRKTYTIFTDIKRF